MSIIRKNYHNFKIEHSQFSMSKIWKSLFAPYLPWLKNYVCLLMSDIKLYSNFTTNDEEQWLLFVATAL